MCDSFKKKNKDKNQRKLCDYCTIYHIKESEYVATFYVSAVEWPVQVGGGKFE